MLVELREVPFLLVLVGQVCPFLWPWLGRLVAELWKCLLCRGGSYGHHVDDLCRDFCRLSVTFFLGLSTCLGCIVRWRSLLRTNERCLSTRWSGAHCMRQVHQLSVIDVVHLSHYLLGLLICFYLQLRFELPLDLVVGEIVLLAV